MLLSFLLLCIEKKTLSVSNVCLLSFYSHKGTARCTYPLMTDSTGISTRDATADLPVAYYLTHTCWTYTHTVQFMYFFSMCKRDHVPKESEGGREKGRGVSPEKGGSSAPYSTMRVWNHQLYFSMFSFPTRLDQVRH